jgi:hypothetical protein
VDPAQRIVTGLPLAELWNNKGLLDAHRAAQVGEADIVRLLRDGSSFMVADVGLPLQWISEDDRFEFWRTEVKRRLVPPEADGFNLDDYPGNYCYVATIWKRRSATPVIVLERHH